MLPASRAACVPVFMATPTSACAQCGRVVRPVAAHGDALALSLLFTDEPKLVLGRGLRKEIVDASFRCNRGSSHWIVASDHHRADAHTAKLGEALADAALYDILKVNDAEQFSSFATASGVPPDFEMRSAIILTSLTVSGLTFGRSNSTALPGPIAVAGVFT